jgi:hypothetical protein
MSMHRLSRRQFQIALSTGFAWYLSQGAEGQEQKALQGGERLGPGASLRGLRVFPSDNPWNENISERPVDALSDRILARIGLDKPLHPDFGTTYEGKPSGIPYVVVSGTQPRVPVKFDYADESDPGPYPIPPDAPIEGGPGARGDRHILVIDREAGKLFELFASRRDPDGKGWKAGSGAVFDLNSNRMRPEGWTSADAAGLPVFPGLVRYDEVAGQGAVHHAFRFTVRRTRRAYVHPARHFASRATDVDLPPMGMRVRLKALYDTRKFPPQARVILEALKSHGMMLADNGGDWFLSGAPDPRWDDEDLGTLKRVKVRDFEIIAMGEMVTR